MNLIDKDALVAKIERLRKKNNESENVYDFGTEGALKSILSFINTLEVKEVDLEKEFNDFLDNVEGVPRMWHPDEQIEWAKDIAKHFFELGLKARQG